MVSAAWRRQVTVVLAESTGQLYEGKENKTKRLNFTYCSVQSQSKQWNGEHESLLCKSTVQYLTGKSNVNQRLRSTCSQYTLWVILSGHWCSVQKSATLSSCAAARRISSSCSSMHATPASASARAQAQSVRLSQNATLQTALCRSVLTKSVDRQCVCLTVLHR